MARFIKLTNAVSYDRATRRDTDGHKDDEVILNVENIECLIKHEDEYWLTAIMTYIYQLSVNNTESKKERVDFKISEEDYNRVSQELLFYRHHAETKE